MSHPVEDAVKLLEMEVYNLQSDHATRPGAVRWFQLQAKGCALSMLRGMIQANMHHSSESAELYRQAIKVKGFTAEELGVENAEQ